MNLDQRGWDILRKIVDNPTIMGKELEEQLHISRKQLGYALEKINDYLDENNFPKIERLRTGKFRISSSLIELYKSADTEIKSKSFYIYSDKERCYLILLILMCSREELSTYHFTSELQISKNTLLLDLKKLQEIISAYKVMIHYNRKSGYTLLGSEYKKRELAILAIRRILEMPEGKLKISKLTQITKEDLKQINDGISNIERTLSIQFTDERMNELPYILYVAFCRIKNGHLLVELPEAFQHIVGTKEYTAVVLFANEFGITEPLEKLFLTAQIQISNLSSFKTAKEDVEMKMLEAAKQVIKNFELICCIRMKEKEQLLEALIQHWRPAYYRIKYNYHIENSITGLILPQHNHLHGIVKKSICPFEEMMGVELPEEELAYITLLFGGWLKREGLLDFVEEQKKAVVVCANGVSVSNFLLITLRELFPEIEFLRCLSIREFQDYEQDYNIVFTTERLKTDKIQFIVTPFLNEYSKQKFREKVFQELSGVSSQTIQITDLLDIIEQHATIHSKDKLIRRINRYINATEETTYDKSIKELASTTNIKLGISDLLTEETVQVLNCIYDWKKVIEIGSAPLLEKGYFEPRYVRRMIDIIENEKPFIMVANGVVIAHAGVDEGVIRLGMALVKLPEKISVGGYMDADIVIILGTPDNTIHLGALYSLLEILENEEKLEKLHMVKEAKELLELL